LTDKSAYAERRVALDQVGWSDGPSREQVIVTRQHHSGHVIEIPVAVTTGARGGPTLAVMSGMHAGEYAGVLAAQRLVQQITPDVLSGRLIVVPVISTLAFMERNMQLNPVDQKEPHFQAPGNPGGSYTECLIDTLFELVSGADYLIDSHSGEMAQALYPWVPVPMIGPPELQERSRSLAAGFDVPYIELRSNPSSVPRLCVALAEGGVANVWVEAGKNGVPTEKDVRIHYDGYIAALHTAGMLEGTPARPAQSVLSGRRYQVNSSRSGVWHPAIKEGDIVEQGQLLGILTDYFGNELERFFAPERSLVLYYWTNPAINADRRPHGYDWHNGLVSLITLEG
jgi:hypothetical protein